MQNAKWNTKGYNETALEIKDPIPSVDLKFLFALNKIVFLTGEWFRRYPTHTHALDHSFAEKSWLEEKKDNPMTTE